MSFRFPYALEINYNAATSRFICKKDGKMVKRIACNFALNHGEQVKEIGKELFPNCDQLAIAATGNGWVVVPVE